MFQGPERSLSSCMKQPGEQAWSKVRRGRNELRLGSRCFQEGARSAVVSSQGTRSDECLPVVVAKGRSFLWVRSFSFGVIAYVHPRLLLTPSASPVNHHT